MVADSEIRVSDAEREASAADLREHFASGRLSQDDFDARLDAAFAAKTRGDLRALFSDLPPAGAWPGATTDPRQRYQGQVMGGPAWRGGNGNGNGGWSRGPGRAAGTAIAAIFFLAPLLVVLGVASVLTIGSGRPLGIVVLIAALAVLRRLLLAIFGRRGFRRCGPRRRRR